MANHRLGNVVDGPWRSAFIRVHGFVVDADVFSDHRPAGTHLDFLLVRVLDDAWGSRKEKHLVERLSSLHAVVVNQTPETVVGIVCFSQHGLAELGFSFI